MEVFGFKIRKLSVYNGVSWHHFPHRSDLSIHFLKEKDGISTSILWKGTTLHKCELKYSIDTVCSVISRFPSIGFKQTEMFGKVLVRFQVGFSDQQEYDKCCVCIENNLDLPIISRENSNDMSGEFSKNLTLFPDSQVIMSQSDFKQPPNRASQIAAQNPFQDSQVASSNLESQYHHRSQQKQQTQSQTQHPQAQSQTPTQAKPLTQSRPTHSVAYPDYSRLLLTPMSDNYPSSSYIQTSPIATNKRAPLNVHQRSHQSQQPLISDQDNSSGVNLRQILSELDNGSELYSMSDTELKNTIVEVLKQKSFVDIVKRIDTILEDS